MSSVLAGGTIFLSAFFLFQVQPMVAKAILPWFGGSAAVWGTCLVFFQSLLFLGYLYAHWLTHRVKPAVQPWIHAGLLAASVLFLPVLPSESWKPGGNENPSIYILILLAANVGLPYLLLSSTSPLVQAWYARTGGQLPYRYFALSNASSLVALLGYPALVEPYFGLPQQSMFWTSGYLLYGFGCAAVAWFGTRGNHPLAETVEESAAAPSMGEKSLWLVLAAVPSILSLAVTSHLSQNLAPIPMMWVLPLAVYLLSFVVTFESQRWYRRPVVLAFHAIALAGISYLLTRLDPENDVRWTVGALLLGMFAWCVFCHGELVLRKPVGAHLTTFYLMIALGGAVGAILVGLIAPVTLTGPYELPVAIAACALFTLLLEYKKRLITDLALTGVAVGCFVAAGTQMIGYKLPARISMRNFYGGVRVVDDGVKRSLVHGVVTHGTQFVDASRRLSATSYYAPGTGVQRAIEATRKDGQRVGVIGLGIGTLAAYGREGDSFRFYEINPQVVDLARREFSFLTETKAKVEIVVGDGRLSLEREEPQKFDLLVIDAFSGDAVPVHLLSREALRLYLQHTAEAGIVAFHVSNSALSLAEVVRRVAEAEGRAAVRIVAAGDPAIGRSLSDWVLVTRDPVTLAQGSLQAFSAPFNPIAGLRPWTDNYSTLFPILK